MDWSSVSDKIVQDDQNKWDRKLAGHEVRMSGEGGLELLTEMAQI